MFRVLNIGEETETEYDQTVSTTTRGESTLETEEDTFLRTSKLNHLRALNGQLAHQGRNLSESRTELDRIESLSKSTGQREPVPVVTVPPTTGHHTVTTGRAQVLDLMQNDNSFHVIAKLVIDRFEDQLNVHSQSITITAGDRYHLDRVVPAKKNFIEAVQYRLQNCPENSTKPTHVVTRRCRALGLHLEGDMNPLNAPVGAVIRIDVSIHAINSSR